MAVCIVLQVLVVGERRRFDDDLLEEFDGEISRDEALTVTDTSSGRCTLVTR